MHKPHSFEHNKQIMSKQNGGSILARDMAEVSQGVCRSDEILLFNAIDALCLPSTLIFCLFFVFSLFRCCSSSAVYAPCLMTVLWSLFEIYIFQNLYTYMGEASAYIYALDNALENPDKQAEFSQLNVGHKLNVRCPHHKNRERNQRIGSGSGNRRLNALIVA